MSSSTKASPADIMPLANVMARLRDPDTGCPWDIQQDFASIAPYTIEEAYEVADAIERNDMPALCDELGDLLLQVAFHSRMAEQAGHFNLQDVIDGVTDKMIRRHPHIFGEGAEREHGHAQWEAIKAAERAAREPDSSALAGVANALQHYSAPKSSRSAPPALASTGPTPKVRSQRLKRNCRKFTTPHRPKNIRRRSATCCLLSSIWPGT